MKTCFCVYFFTITLLVGCASENPNKLKASEVLKEINEIAVEHRKNGKFDEVISISKKFNDDRNLFPERRGQLREGADFLKNFFVKEIEKNERIIQKFNALLELNLSAPETECVKHQINSLEKRSEKIKLSISDFDLFLDESIRDKKTLDSKSQPIKSKIEMIDSEINLLEEQDKLKCSRK
jgi:hypothetical protein